jgi:hypothetical protein
MNAIPRDTAPLLALKHVFPGGGTVDPDFWWPLRVGARVVPTESSLGGGTAPTADT